MLRNTVLHVPLSAVSACGHCRDAEKDKRKFGVVNEILYLHEHRPANFFYTGEERC